MKIKISNSSDIYGSVVMFSGVFLFACIGLGISNVLPLSASEGAGLTVGCMFLGLLAALAIISGKTTEVDYDGNVIKLKNFYGKKEIDLAKVKSVSFDYVKGYGRGATDNIRLEFIPYETNGDASFPETLYETITGELFNMIMKGDYSKFPLMQMYEDIINRYPEKNAKEKTEEN